MALSAAETGHLVFSTLHTRDAKGVISRYADLFPQSDQGEVRAQPALEPPRWSASISCPMLERARDASWRWKSS